MAAPPICEPPVPVVGGLVAVQRDTHLNPVLGEQIAEPLVEQHAVGLDAQAKPGYRGNPGAQRVQHRAQPVVTQQQWLAAMQHHVDGI